MMKIYSVYMYVYVFVYVRERGLKEKEHFSPYVFYKEKTKQIKTFEQTTNKIFRCAAEEMRKFIPILYYSLCIQWPFLEKNIVLMTFILFFWIMS